VFVADPSLVSPIPAVPSVEQLLVLLAERDGALAARDALIVELAARVADLEAPVGEELPEQLEATEFGCVREATATVASPGVGS
jgi:hypothetical protein